MRGAWNQFFPEDVLDSLDQTAHELDKNWPVRHSVKHGDTATDPINPKNVDVVSLKLIIFLRALIFVIYVARWSVGV